MTVESAAYSLKVFIIEYNTLLANKKPRVNTLVEVFALSTLIKVCASVCLILII